MVNGQSMGFRRIFTAFLYVRILIDFSLELNGFSWVGLLFSWNLDVCRCVARALLVCLVLSDASLADSVSNVVVVLGLTTPY